MESEACRVCREAFTGEYISTEYNSYHKDCFRCFHCLEHFEENPYFESDYGLFCDQDNILLALYHLLTDLDALNVETPLKENVFRLWTPNGTLNTLTGTYNLNK